MSLLLSWLVLQLLLVVAAVSSAGLVRWLDARSGVLLARSLVLACVSLTVLTLLVDGGAPYRAPVSVWSDGVTESIAGSRVSLTDREGLTAELGAMELHAPLPASIPWGALLALVLAEAREAAVKENYQPTHPVIGSSMKRSMASLGVAGIGHEFWVDDTPGGPDVTALVAFLLALDDCPGDVVGTPCEPRKEVY